jgi:hypothetical protein
MADAAYTFACSLGSRGGVVSRQRAECARPPGPGFGNMPLRRAWPAQGCQGHAGGTARSLPSSTRGPALPLRDRPRLLRGCDRRRARPRAERPATATGRRRTKACSR